jgi:anthranilate phosphoribosyltransferase
MFSNIFTFCHYRSTSAMMMMTEILRVKTLTNLLKAVACPAHVECGVLAFFLSTNAETRRNDS